MVPAVRPEHCEGLPVDVRIPETPGLNDGTDVGRLGLELALQHPRGAPLGNLKLQVI